MSSTGTPALPRDIYMSTKAHFVHNNTRSLQNVGGYHKAIENPRHRTDTNQAEFPGRTTRNLL